MLATILLLAQTTVTVEVPDVDTPWPGRAIVEGHGPFAAFLDDEPLPTQWESHLRDELGQVESSWVAFTVPAGLEAGTELEVELRPETPGVGPEPLPKSITTLLKGHETWALYVKGIDGGVYGAVPTGPVVAVRSGAVESVWRRQYRIEPLMEEDSGPLQLPHMGVVTMDLRVWGGVEVMDVRVLWEGGVVDDPNAWALFDGVGLFLAPGGVLDPINPTIGAEPHSFGMIRLAPEGGTLPHHAKLWALEVSKKGVDSPIVRGGGWGTSESIPTALGPMLITDPVEVDVDDELGQLLADRASGASLDGSQGATTWRHPSGIGYGGGTGGQGVGPWPYYDFARADVSSTYHYLLAWMETRMDRTRVSLVREDGSTWWPTAEYGPFNFSISPGQLYGDTQFQTAWPSSSQDPFGFRTARLDYREATEQRYIEDMAADRHYGTEDNQHFTRPNQALWPMIELYREPIALLYGERVAAAAMADYFHDGQEGNFYTSSLSSLATGEGPTNHGRGLAWLGWHCSLMYAYGSNEQRSRIAPWLGMWTAVIQNRTEPNGIFQVINNSKEVDYSYDEAGHGGFWPTQSYQNAFVMITSCQVANVFHDGLLEVVAKQVEGQVELGWDPEAPGPDYRHAAELVDGTPLFTRAEVLEVYSTSVDVDPPQIQTFHAPLIAAAALMSGVEFTRPLGNSNPMNELPYQMLQD